MIVFGAAAKGPARLAASWSCFSESGKGNAMIPKTPKAIEALHRLHRLHRPHAGIRHDNGPIPSELAERLRHERAWTWWTATALVALALLLALVVVPAVEWWLS